eukprot:6899811-Alexandrium_andersonii.AAC.1
MLFEGPFDPMRNLYKELRANPVSPWAGPKAILDEVELAALEPGGLNSVIFVVVGNEDDTGN